jgi:hypothetical protein
MDMRGEAADLGITGTSGANIDQLLEAIGTQNAAFKAEEDADKKAEIHRQGVELSVRLTELSGAKVDFDDLVAGRVDEDALLEDIASRVRAKDAMEGAKLGTSMIGLIGQLGEGAQHFVQQAFDMDDESMPEFVKTELLLGLALADMEAHEQKREGFAGAYDHYDSFVEHTIQSYAPVGVPSGMMGQFLPENKAILEQIRNKINSEIRMGSRLDETLKSLYNGVGVLDLQHGGFITDDEILSAAVRLGEAGIDQRELETSTSFQQQQEMDGAQALAALQLGITTQMENGMPIEEVIQSLYLLRSEVAFPITRDPNSNVPLSLTTPMIDAVIRELEASIQ